VVGLLLTTFNCAMAAFALRKKHLHFRRFYIAVLLLPTFFQGGLIPTYLNYRNLHLLDNFLVYILPRSAHFFYLIVLISAFSDISNSLEDSAKIDGAGYFRIFLRIYFPLSIPIVATVALFEGVDQWNSWFDTVYFTSSSHLVTMAAFLLRIVKEANLAMYNYDVAKDMGTRNLEGVKLAVIVISVVPIAMIYPFFQRYFAKGLTVGSMKE
jgi:putative aldouronate transport system permease protein